MACYLGVDTSNYTTSAALYDSGENRVNHRRKLLPVTGGALGLRQSDAVFSHIKQLPGLLEELLAGAAPPPAALGVSLRPRDAEGSYMPCFLVGQSHARGIAAALGAPLYGFSHQAGHVMAALYSAGRLDLVQKEFLAFHVSGGTTDCLLVRPEPRRVFEIETLGSSLDLKAGQAVDRVGGMLGLDFPAGRALDDLSLTSRREFCHRPSLKGNDCCLSGIENICRAMKDRGEAAADIARCCLDYIGKTIEAMTDRALAAHPGLAVVYCGGVMSNTLLRQRLTARGNVFFASAELSSDNACGAALLAAHCHREGREGL